MSQLAAQEGKYLGPGKETCISPPSVQNNNSLLLQPCVSASQNSSNYHTSLHSFRDLIVPGSQPAEPLSKKEKERKEKNKPVEDVASSIESLAFILSSIHYYAVMTLKCNLDIYNIIIRFKINQTKIKI